VRAASDEVLWAGDFDALGESRVLADAMPAAAQWDVRIDVELRSDAGNDTMTDAVAFSMSWSARGEQVAGEAVVAGVEAFRPGGGVNVAGVELPFTGVTIQPWLIWFGGVLILGGALLLGSRRMIRVPAH
jgi:LPXTG-motif cell wall-anchored protein